MSTEAATTETALPGEVWDLVDDKVLVMSNPYALDGRVTSYPRDVRGYSPMQCYLLRAGNRALLIGTGLSIHQRQILVQLEEIVGEAKLSMIPSGYDFTRLCNARPIADRFGLEVVYQRPPGAPAGTGPVFDVPLGWLNFRPEFPLDETDGLRKAKAQGVTAGQPLNFNADCTRRLEVLVPPLRLLPNQWLYDTTTRTLFSVDVFSWILRSTAAGPWVVTDDDESTTTEMIEHMLFDNRYWWLPGADTTRIRKAFADLFDKYEIENIAPEYGCVLKGASVVGRHYQMLDDVLAAAARQPAHGVDVGRWTFAAGGAR